MIPSCVIMNHLIRDKPILQGNLMGHPMHIVRIRNNAGHTLPLSIIRYPGNFSGIPQQLQHTSYTPSSAFPRNNDFVPTSSCEIARGKIDIGAVVPYSLGSDERWPYPDYISIEEQKRQSNFELKADDDLLKECCEDEDIEFLLFELIWSHIREDREFHKMIIHDKIIYT